VPKDRWRENAPASAGGGLLLDLGAHLVDSAVQLFGPVTAVQLFGPVTAVHAELAARTTPSEDDVFLSCTHARGVRSHLSATSLAGAPGPRTRVLGTRGAYVVTSFEGEESAFPDLADADDASTGWVVAGAERTPVPREPGEHADLYRAVAAALTSGGGQAAMPVQPEDAVHVLAVLDAARASAARDTSVAVAGEPGWSS